MVLSICGKKNDTLHCSNHALGAVPNIIMQISLFFHLTLQFKLVNIGYGALMVGVAVAHVFQHSVKPKEEQR